MAKKDLMPICSTCKSDDVLGDAYASFNPASQAWELQNVFAKGAHCNKCDGETSLTWVNVEDYHAIL